jgi:hypothetical protein
MHGHELLTDDSGDDPLVGIIDPVDRVVKPIIQEVLKPKLSLHAISNSIASKTMRLIGLIHNQQVVILIDSSSTHNFIDSEAFPKLSLCDILPLQLRVRVANGNTIMSSRKCTDVQIYLTRKRTNCM